MKIVAVTSCPTGIAHSQMAAENLERTAEELGHDISVEIQGAMGAENELSAERIAAAGAVVIAADTSVSRDRFEGKPVVKGTVKDAVNDARSTPAPRESSGYSTSRTPWRTSSNAPAARPPTGPDRSSTPLPPASTGACRRSSGRQNW